jgi:hypothetical protein
MIDPKELRIGNWVSIYEETETNLRIDRNILGNLMLGWFTTELYPIPITPEWLERIEELGVLSDDDQKRYEIKIDQKTIVVIWTDPIEVEVCHYYSEVTTLCKHIQYIHQLQNLYFALTGTELTIKDKA